MDAMTDHDYGPYACPVCRLPSVDGREHLSCRREADQEYAERMAERAAAEASTEREARRADTLFASPEPACPW